jgi:hypothetical protein
MTLARYSLLAGALALCATAAAQPEPKLSPKTKGRVGIAVPNGWQELVFEPGTEVVGLWTVDGNPIPKTGAAILVGRSATGEFKVDPKDVEIRETATALGGRAAKRFDLTDKTDAGNAGLPGRKSRSIVLVTKDPKEDGQFFVFVLAATADQWNKHAAAFEAAARSITIDGKGGAAPKPVGERLTELASAQRIAGFSATFAYTAYEDRVALADSTGRTTVVGVAGARGKPVGTALAEFLAREPELTALLGEPVTYETSALGAAVTFQVFRGGTVVKERATGAIWWNAHPKRPIDLRPADELTRYPVVSVAGARYEVMTYRTRVVVTDTAGKRSMAVDVGRPGSPIPEAFRKVLASEKIEEVMGRAVSGAEPLFETAARVQVYESGVLIVVPETGTAWWARHSRRPASDADGPKAVALPKDGGVAVIEVDYVGGYTPPRKTNAPFLTIRADGRVTLVDPFGDRKPVEVKLDPDTVLEFLKFAVSERHFFDIDSATMEREIQTEAKRLMLPKVLDLPTTVVRVRTAAGAHEVRGLAPEFYVEHAPKAHGVQDFNAVHKRLADYMEKLRGP